MADTDDIKSILAADFGSVNTRVILIDLVDGAYRLVARAMTRTTADDPVRDVSVGLFRGLELLTEQTGRALLAGRKDQVLMPEGDGQGVDAVLATASVGQPLDVVVVGLMPDVSVSSALHVLTGSYARVVDTLSLADIRTEQEQINAILARKPDLIFIVGGTDAGAEEPILELVRVVLSAVQIATKKPMVLFAGNRAIQAEVNELLQDATNLFVVDNIRPSLVDEALGPAQQGLAAVYNRFKVNGGGGFEEVSAISKVGVLPTAQSYTHLVRYLGAVARKDHSGQVPGVLAVDVGSATTMAASSIQRRGYTCIRTDIGVGHSALGTLSGTTPGNVRRWLTWDAPSDEILAYAYNKSLRPATVPQSEQELELEYALAREAIRLVVGQAREAWPGGAKAAPPLRPIIGAGAVLAQAPHPGYAALLLLDAIQPVGVTELLLDPAGLIPALGAVGYLQPSAVVQMLDAGDLLRIGSAVCVDGRVRRIGYGGMRVTIKLPGGQVERRQVAAGTLWTYPLPPGQTARVEVKTSRGLSIDGKSSLKLTLEGGAAGLIFDARGRPLPLPRNAEARARLYPAWVAGTQGTIRLRVDEVDQSQVDRDALGTVEIMTGEEKAAESDGIAEIAEEEKPRRRGVFGFLRRTPAPHEEDAGETPASEMMAELEAIAAARSADEVRAPAPAPAAEPAKADSDEMLSELRESTQETGKKRRFRR